MTRTARTIAAMVMLMGVGVIETAEAGMSRVRTDTPTIAALIGAATVRSATFRELVDTINETNGLVFLQAGTCPGRVHACLSHSVTRSGPSRLLRILVDVNRADADVIASIGHELRHALEVLEDPTVDSSEAVYFLYQRNRSNAGGRYETDAAVHAGLEIRKEMLRAAAGN